MHGILSSALGATLALAATVANANNLANTASVFMHGEPGSWVSGALGAPEVTWVHGIEGIFSGGTNFSQGVSITYSGDAYWSFDFAAPSYNPVTNTNDGQPLTVGFYNNATRWPFNSPTKPGLSVSGNGRGDNQLSGWFNVLEIAYGSNGDILRFAVDFRQYDENLTMSGPSLYGSLRFNSAIPLSPVPESSTLALWAGGLAALTVLRARRRVA